MKKYALICLLSFAFIGCVKVEDIDESNGPTSPRPQPIVESTGEWNRFRVKLPAIEGVQSVARRNLSWAKPQFEVLAFEMREGRFIDENPESGSVTEYVLKGISEGESKVLATYQVQIPLDLEIKENFEITKNTDWFVHRLILHSGGTITTNGHSLKMKVLDFESQGGVIRTFPAGAQAAIGERGRSGSRIEIEIQNAEGSLKLELRGERGGNGPDGKSHSSAQAQSGKNGRSGRRVMDVCVGQGTAGEPGVAGLKGNKGSDGLPGGNSGSAVVIFHTGSLLVQEIFENGLGGSGGSGGQGQRGGSGGQGGLQSCISRLPDGPKGRDGSDGDPGAVGPQGLKETFCFQLPNQKMNCR